MVDCLKQSFKNFEKLQRVEHTSMINSVLMEIYTLVLND